MLTEYSGNDKEYHVPEGTESIGELAFAGSDRLERLYIPDSVRAIGNYAFMNCYSLREIRLPEMVERLGAGLFQNCWQLRKVSVPEGALSLGTDMFENCHALTEIWLPVSLEEAARTSLSGCRNLRSIHISSGQIDILPPSARYTAVLTFMEEHASGGTAEKDRSVIRHYVKNRQKSFLDLAINRKSTEAVRYMLSDGLLDDIALKEYLHKSAETGRVEITALLLDSLNNGDHDVGLSSDPFL